MTELFAAPVQHYPMDAYKDDPKSIGAAVEWACNAHGLFQGVKVQRSTLLVSAAESHHGMNGSKTWPEHETLGRELRHRNPKTRPGGKVSQRMHFADRVLLQGWRIVCDNGRVWAERI